MHLGNRNKWHREFPLSIYCKSSGNQVNKNASLVYYVADNSFINLNSLTFLSDPLKVIMRLFVEYAVEINNARQI